MVRRSPLYVWLRLARPGAWLLSKVSFAAAAGLILFPEVPLPRFVGMIAAVIAWAAFGYGFNEVVDRAHDARAGKTNRATGLTGAGRTGFLVFTGGAALALAGVSAVDLAAPVFVLAGLALAVAYSVPPLRLKERGLAGIAAGAVAQWMLPVLAIAAIEPGGWTRPAAWSFALLGLAIGVRWMGVHQLNDTLKDRVAGVRTFASLRRPVVPLIYAAFAIELVLLAGMLVVAWPRSIDAAATLGVWVATAALFRNPLQGFRGRLRRHVDAPFAGYYFRALPAVMLLEAALPIGLWYRAGFAALGAHGVALMVRRRGADRSAPIGPPPSPPPQPVTAALSFLLDGQHQSGEFRVVVGRDPTLRDGTAVRCVFETAFVARILEPWESDDRVAQLLEGVRGFLRAEREPSGLWRYFGRDSIIPPDADDTACALLVLPPSPGDDAVIGTILGNCDPRGAVRTWFSDPACGPPYPKSVDACVNANVYSLLRRRSITAPGIRRFLKKTLLSRRFLDGSPYYPSPFFFLYAIADFGDELDPTVPSRIEREVVELLSRSRITSILDSALASSALAACGAAEEARRTLLENVRSHQRPDGGWPAEALCSFQGGRLWYGSRELTTAFCLEALAQGDPAAGPRTPLNRARRPRVSLP